MAFTVGANTTVQNNVLAKEVLYQLDEKFVMASWANGEYKGEILAGQNSQTVSVKIFPRITHSTGTVAGDDIAESTFAITSEDLTIDQLKQLNVRIGAYENFLDNLNLIKEVAAQLMYDMKDTIDAYFATVAIAGTNATNLIATSVVTKATIFADIEAMRVKLSEANAYGESALFVKPEIATLLRQSGVYDATSDGLGVREEGYVTKISGFKVYESNNLPTGKMLGVVRDAVNLVVQWTYLKIKDKENAAAEGIVSEWAYGAKVFSPMNKALVVKTYTLS